MVSENDHRYNCSSCEFQFYNNVAATVSVVMVCGREILFAKRGRNPSKGRLDFPGGFVDPGESLEEALLREMQEELRWQPKTYQYLFSFANTYPFAGVTYKTADAFFLCKVDSKPDLFARDDVASLVWSSIDDLDRSHLAFDSMSKAVAALSGMTF